MANEIDLTSNDTGEIAREVIVSKMSNQQRALVLPDLKPRRGRYKASDVEQAFRDVAQQMDDFQTLVTQEVLQLLTILITEVYRDTQRMRDTAAFETEDLRNSTAADIDAARAELAEERAAFDKEVEEIRSKSVNDATETLLMAQIEAERIIDDAKAQAGELYVKFEKLRQLAAEVTSVVNDNP
ncbi:MAG: hypothetical protein LW606_09305 [Ilumatobacteraceae bacterium]|jgi:hypothetical protein|nr:hypothetical protein [Ilumatobacteraceae bacterium]